MEEKKSNATSNQNTKNTSFWALKNEAGQYYIYGGTTPQSTLDDLLSNGEDLFEGERYEEALECYLSALSKPELSKYDRWNVLTNCALPLAKLGRYTEALAKFEEALQNLHETQSVHLYGWLVETKMKAVMGSMPTPNTLK
jgi:tetratricopeptide (TPR) repeat protein